MGSSPSQHVSVSQEKIKKSKFEPKKASVIKSAVEVGPKDVMISYSHQDMEMMQKLQKGLEANGISVWVDTIGLNTGVDFLSKIGQAIIDAKLFISLVSKDQILSKYCKDETALAHISEKEIFPVFIGDSNVLFQDMDTGMRLQLANYEWHDLDGIDDFDTNFNKLVLTIKTSLEEVHNRKHTDTSSAKEFIRRTSSSLLIKTQQKNVSFWDDHFHTKSNVSWQEFWTAITTEFKLQLAKLFNKMDDQKWLCNIVKKELLTKGNVSKKKYTDFCTTDDGRLIPIWLRIQEVALESYAIRAVFDMKSSVRMDAITNLSRYKSEAVVNALLDLLNDEDNNVQTTAVLSLARTGVISDRVVDKLIEACSDDDRLVRESACLALGHLKVEKAVPTLVKKWRVDVISHVREAAALALEKIGGQEAAEAINMTKVLSDEIRILMKS